VIADRTWEPIGENAWALCVGFGDETTNGWRVCLREDFRRWSLHHVRPAANRPGDGPAWISVSGPDIAVHDGPMETEDAMRWALAELSALARDRAKRYTDQLYAIMNEAAR